MESSQNSRERNASAYPASDEQELLPTLVKKIQGLPPQGRERLQKESPNNGVEDWNHQCRKHDRERRTTGRHAGEKEGGELLYTRDEVERK